MTCGFPLLQILDIDELIKPRREAAKKKMLDEIRDETVESAISKITAAKQSQQFEATEEEESEFNIFQLFCYWSPVQLFLSSHLINAPSQEA